MRMESTFGEAGGDRMEKLYRILKIFLWCAIGIFVGQSIYQCYDYARPGLYASNSAPWYTSILLSGVVTLIIVLLMLLVMWMIQKKLSKK